MSPEGRVWFAESVRRDSAWRRDWERSTVGDSGCGRRWRDLESEIRVAVRRREQLEQQAVRLGLDRDQVLALLSAHRLAIWWD